MVWFLWILSLTPNAFAANVCESHAPKGAQREVERINERYDDFFRYRAEAERREAAMNASRGERKASLMAREIEMEKARRQLVKERRPRPDTSALEAQFMAEQKARSKALEEARMCLVMQKAAAERVLKKGRKIPEHLEYDLEP